MCLVKDWRHECGCRQHQMTELTRHSCGWPACSQAQVVWLVVGQQSTQHIIVATCCGWAGLNVAALAFGLLYCTVIGDDEVSNYMGVLCTLGTT